MLKWNTVWKEMKPLNRSLNETLKSSTVKAKTPRMTLHRNSFLSKIRTRLKAIPRCFLHSAISSHKLICHGYLSAEVGHLFDWIQLSEVGNWVRWHQKCTKPDKWGLQLLTTQKKTSARSVQHGFTLGCCSKGPDSSLWPSGASAGSSYLPKHTNAATWMPCKQLYQLCYTTKQPDTSTNIKKITVLYISPFSAFPQSSTSSASFISGYNCRSKLLIRAASLPVQLEPYLLCW